MDKLIAQFPKQIADALSIADSSEFSFNGKKSFDNVVVIGMGGSGIGGKMVAQLYAYQINVPIVLVQDYQLPGFVNENTLVVGSSYSGTTEETLIAIAEAEERKATIVGISSGGELVQLCIKKGYDFVRLPAGNPPRSMVAFSMIQLVNILAQAKIINEDALDDFRSCRPLLNNELMTIKHEAKLLANHFFQKQGIIYTDADSEAVAIRTRQQINENSKQLVWHHVIPEMNHNELVGWGRGNDDYAVLFLESQFLNDRNKLRFKINKEIISEKTQNILTIHGKGKNLVQEYFYFIHIVDWASVFLAEMNKQDAVEVRVIDYLKGTLKNS
ncbi:MAG TPA: bifunctional phosphoglucose/phosphomannose isomerase [Brumimicrobium sp.]|nr:bifunctional phosphoglucose/phosphomannose isomerase [Brumimicrobium sp.]